MRPRRAADLRAEVGAVEEPAALFRAALESSIDPDAASVSVSVLTDDEGESTGRDRATVRGD